jgi:hypothetical protein
MTPDSSGHPSRHGAFQPDARAAALNSRKDPNAETASLALDALAGSGNGHWVDRPAESRGGRPSRDFVLQPTTDDTDATPRDEQDGGGGSPAGSPDQTPPPSDETPRIAGENGVPSVSSVVGRAEHPAGDRPGMGWKVSSGGEGFRRPPRPTWWCGTASGWAWRPPPWAAPGGSAWTWRRPGWTRAATASACWRWPRTRRTAGGCVTCQAVRPLSSGGKRSLPGSTGL